jgi:hypothetical protein
MMITNDRTSCSLLPASLFNDSVATTNTIIHSCYRIALEFNFLIQYLQLFTIINWERKSHIVVPRLVETYFFSRGSTVLEEPWPTHI